MKQLWAPWRFEYISSQMEEGCILCHKPKEERDDATLILLRGERNFVILNIFPYNPGHLMVAPYRHVGNPEDLTPEEMEEHYRLVAQMVKLLKSTLQPQGFNIGQNLGKAGGAALVDHLHTHIVPRWEGDTNFMPLLADTKVIVEALNATYNRLKEALRTLGKP